MQGVAYNMLCTRLICNIYIYTTAELVGTLYYCTFIYMYTHTIENEMIEGKKATEALRIIYTCRPMIMIIARI